ncbi:MAG TPA: DUF4249 domain-containing protein [Chitinophagaceae bacterium]|nr:DUF4249 domain-containing protein [Chitinophagaceae bacterium]
MYKLLYPFTLVLAVLLYEGCRKPYLPEAIAEAPSILVVEGMINGNAGGVTRVELTRSVRLSDENETAPETAAQVSIEEENGGRHMLMQVQAGVYESLPLTLAQGKKYRLQIRTGDGTEYLSEYVPMLHSPEIDSISYAIEENDLVVMANTHDPDNNTRYYRWSYGETWEYHGPYLGHLEYRNGQVVMRPLNEFQQICYSSQPSASILLGSSTKLSEDVIKAAELTIIPRDDVKLSVRYSMLVRQQALTKEAYEFWQILKKTSEQQGGLFDMQPAELPSNFTCVTRPEEPVIGYLTASTFSEKRVFITRAQALGTFVYRQLCDEKVIPQIQDSIDFYLRPPTSFAPAYFITGGGLAIAQSSCVNCTELGGTNVKPDFW